MSKNVIKSFKKNYGALLYDSFFGIRTLWVSLKQHPLKVSRSAGVALTNCSALSNQKSLNLKKDSLQWGDQYYNLLHDDGLRKKVGGFDPALPYLYMKK
jgi:hypothetical protein